MELERPPVRGTLAQWGGLASAIVACLGLLWGFVNHLQDMAADVRVNKVRISQLEVTQRDLQLRLDHEREEMAKLREEIAKVRDELNRHLYGGAKNNVP